MSDAWDTLVAIARDPYGVLALVGVATFFALVVMIVTILLANGGDDS